MTTTSPADAQTERLRELPRCLERQTGFAEVLDSLRQGSPGTLDGVWGSSCALAAAALALHAPRLLVVVLPRPGDADAFADDWSLFSASQLASFPALESAAGERSFRDEDFGERLRLLKQLASPAVPRAVVTSLPALLQPVPSPPRVRERTLHLTVGQRVELDPLLEWFVARRFHRTSAVELPGEFSLRGGILDIFAPDWRNPVRLELFDDEIVSMRRFDAASQRSLDSVDSVEITFLDPDGDMDAHLSDFAPPGTWFLLVEPDRLEEEGRQYLERVEQPEKYHSVAEVLRRAMTFPMVTAASIARGELGAVCRLPIETIERFSGDIGRVREELDHLGDQTDVLIVTPTDAEVERLSELFGPSRTAAAGRLRFARGALRAGFRLASEQLVVVSSSELFHRGELRRMPRRHLGRAIDSFVDLRSGDLVIHLAHGIGRYRGLEQIVREGRVEEHLVIEFHGGARVFVPATKIDLVQKYVGGTQSRPQLAKLGGTLWSRQKRAAEEAVEDLASEMLEVQAARSSRPGIAFPADTAWQREFDSSFPYTETPDQLAAISAIKTDMQRPRPMDRLLCGDVGYGKTEVAMRAAFKAVDNGYQVAVLAPTTILVEQHHKTFGERLAEFPFEIAKLSRFATAAEQRRTVAGLSSGQIDIVIGTHRLASQDVAFHNLGLVIIDEEQRFGVEVKERLKHLRTTVDVLTTTATPIPRTLHMALVGVRDISNLETPPQDRIAIETRVTRWNEELIRHAILRELSRGGQIYFVHNRIHDIELVASRLRYIVPELRMRIGHGQMPEGELEEVMTDFVSHRFDLLLATTIVESGLDIPNANTIFIDEADRYGLADLHQLRGRVGRYKHQAYCYLLLDAAKHITPNASKRLHAIEEYSDMGAGFAIAMRDLEIRGAGNLLGTQQSGHIAAVGYELYCQLLETAVARLKHLPPKVSLDVEINLPGEAYIPEEYVPDQRLKIDLYRRLTRINDVGQISDLRDELRDRFGEPPPAVEHLLELAELKIDAAIWQVRAIHTDQQHLVFRFANRQRIEQLVKLNQRRLRVVDEQSAYATLANVPSDPRVYFRAAKSLLRPS